MYLSVLHFWKLRKYRFFYSNLWMRLHKDCCYWSLKTTFFISFSFFSLHGIPRCFYDRTSSFHNINWPIYISIATLHNVQSEDVLRDWGKRLHRRTTKYHPLIGLKVLNWGHSPKPASRNAPNNSPDLPQLSRKPQANRSRQLHTPFSTALPGHTRSGHRSHHAWFCLPGSYK